MWHRLSYMAAGVFTVVGAYGIATQDKGYSSLIQGGIIFVLAYSSERGFHRKKS